MYSENMVMKLNEIAHRYRELVHQAIHDVLSKPPYKNTGAGAASLTVDVVDGNAQKAPVIQISFDDHLIFLEKRKIEWTKLPNMKELTAWAETKRDNRKEALKLAFAVAWDKRKNDTWKAKPWRKKSLSKVLKEMNALIIEEFDKAIDADFQRAANNV